MGIFVSKFYKIRWKRYWPTKIYRWPLDFVNTYSHSDHPLLNPYFKCWMSILELSKVPMYGFYYDYIKHKYGNKSRLMFTDTDSLMYEIETVNVYDNFSKSK